MVTRSELIRRTNLARREYAKSVGNRSLTTSEIRSIQGKVSSQVTQEEANRLASINKGTTYEYRTSSGATAQITEYPTQQLPPPKPSSTINIYGNQQAQPQQRQQEQGAVVSAVSQQAPKESELARPPSPLYQYTKGDFWRDAAADFFGVGKRQTIPVYGGFETVTRPLNTAIFGETGTIKFPEKYTGTGEYNPKTGNYDIPQRVNEKVLFEHNLNTNEITISQMPKSMTVETPNFVSVGVLGAISGGSSLLAKGTISVIGAGSVYEGISTKNYPQIALGTLAFAGGTYSSVKQINTEIDMEVLKSGFKYPARIEGSPQVIKQTKESTTYAFTSRRDMGDLFRTKTVSNVEVFNTGNGRVGIFSKDTTTLKYFSAVKDDYVTQVIRTKFSGTGVSLGRGVSFFQNDQGLVLHGKTFGGQGRGVLTNIDTGKIIKNVKFDVISQRFAGYNNIYSGENIKVYGFTRIRGKELIATYGTRSRVTLYGSLKDAEQGSNIFKIGSVSRSSGNIYSQLQRSQTFSIGTQGGIQNNIAKSIISSIPKTSTIPFINTPRTGQVVKQSQTLKMVYSPSIKSFSQATSQSAPVIPTFKQPMFGGSSSKMGAIQFNIPIQPPIQQNEQSPIFNYKPFVSTFAQPVTTFPAFALPLLNKKFSFDFSLGTRKVKGRKRRSKYTPSYEALLLNVSGKQPRGIETGLKLRPIPRGFKWSFGRIKL